MIRLLPLLALLLSACATTEPDVRTPTQSLGTLPTSVNNPIGQAVTTPLGDLGLVHAKIPAVLVDALKSPYAMPADASCPSLAAQVQELESVLGADLDAPPAPNDPGLVERGSSAVREGAGRALKSAAEGVVPYRGWVRKLSGAERYSKQVAAAVAAGIVRRAFLKGIGQVGGCQAPAAPRPAA